MKKIIAINASLRTGWNTAALVQEAAKGAEAKKSRHDEIFPKDLEKAFAYGRDMVTGSWE